MVKIDHQNSDYDFLQSFWGIKEAYPLMKAAAERGFFAALAEDRSLMELKALLSEDETEAELILSVLEECGLVLQGNGDICAAPVAAKNLIDGFLSEEKESAFLWERMSVLLGDIPKDELLIYSDIPQELPDIPQIGILAFLGAYKGDLSVASAMKVLLQYRDQGVDFRFCRKEVENFCRISGLVFTPLISVTDGISVIFAAKSGADLARLTLSKEDQLIADLKKLNISSLKMIDPKEVVVSSWVRDHCRFGCSTFGEKHCPPNSPGYDETWTKLNDYKKALLIEGTPPTRDFQRLMLNAEKTAFKAGFYRSFAYWAGPCSLCTVCNPPQLPKKCTAARPSMESAGIDVFATVRKQGYSLETRKEKSDYVKYFGLLLLD